MTMTTHRQSKQGLQQPGSISSTRQYGLLGTLPYDVVTMVFAFLNQNDCLNCMALNREWYNLVPDCSKSVWKTVVFCGRDIHIQPHSRRAQCLGKHVRHIQLDMTLDEQEDIFYELVKKLLDWGCNEIESLELICSGETFVQPRIIQLLRQLSDARLKHLTLNQHQSNISMQNLLAACPRLTHFTYKPKPLDWYRQYMIYDQEPSLTASITNDNNNSNNDGGDLSSIHDATITYDNLIYLCIDTCISYQARLAPILQKCPNLECFIGLSLSNTSFYAQNYGIPSNNPTTVDLDQVSLWCPNLRFFMGNKTYYELPDAIKKIQSGGRKNHRRHRHSNGNDNMQLPPDYHFSICENHGPEKIVHHLFEHQHRLKYLKLIRQGHFDHIYAWSYAFHALRMPHLHTLILDSVDFDADALITLLSSCLTIDTLVLSRILSALDFSNISTHHRLLSLRRLNLGQSSILDQHATITMVERFPRLEALMAMSSSMMLSHPNTFQYVKHLKDLHLDGAYYWEQGMNDHEEEEENDIPYRPARLRVPVVEPKLFHQLAMHGSCLETIKIRAVEKVDRALLFAIAHIPTIKHMDIELDHDDPSLAPVGITPTTIKNYTTSSSNDCHGSEEEGGDLLFLFAKKLCSTAMGIETLKLEGILYMPTGVLDILGQLPKLNTLSMTTRRRGICPSSLAYTTFVVEPKEVVSFLCKSKSLHELAMDGSGTRKENPRGYSIINSLLEEQGMLSCFSFQNLPSFEKLGDWCLETYKIGRCPAASVYFPAE